MDNLNNMHNANNKADKCNKNSIADKCNKNNMAEVHVERKNRGSSSKVSKSIVSWKIGLITGLIFLEIGIYQEQFQDIFRKAVMICLECIGIG